MDILRFDEGQVWFQASQVWGQDRVVYYENDQELVPLLPHEVPFAYDSEQYVFLWDRDTGIAAITSRVAAWMVKREVEEGPSAVALFGECPEECGYSYELITDRGEECGPFPTAHELIEMGVSDVDSACTMHKVSDGLYECRDQPGGLKLAELQPLDVVGGLGKPEGFVPNGITSSAFTVTTSMKVFTRLCVVGSGEVDLDVQPTGERYTGALSQAGVRWFGKRDHCGKVINMGMVTVGAAKNLSSCVEVEVGDDVRRLYWLEHQSGEWHTKAADVVDGVAVLQVTSKLCGLYVYALTDSALERTSLEPVKVVRAISAVQCIEPLLRSVEVTSGFPLVDTVEGTCYSSLLSSALPDETSVVTWDILLGASLVSQEEMEGYEVVKVGVGRWHVKRGIGLSVARVIAELRAVKMGGGTQITVDDQVIDLYDEVGAVSAMAEVLRKHLVSLSAISLEELDEKGVYLSGMAIGLMNASDKVKARVLQTVGDNVLSLALSLRIYDSGGSAQMYQEVRSQVSSNAYLAGKFGSSVLMSAFQDIGTVLSPKTGGNALEAVAGAVYLAGGMPAVLELMKLVGL